jgi:hypothetical protein
MRRLVPVLFLFLISGCAKKAPAPVPPPPNKDWLVTASWKYDFTNYRLCSPTVTAGCINGFTWGYMTGATKVPLKSSPTTVCAGATQPQSCTDQTNSVLGIGATTFYCDVTGLDNNGAPVLADAVSPPVTVTLVSATNLTIGLQ